LVYGALGWSVATLEQPLAFNNRRIPMNKTFRVHLGGVAELSATSPNDHDNPVTVIRLPANFDRF
jgi:hypothetical protein